MVIPPASDVVRRRLVVTGVVQGVGFRPFVWRHACRHGLVGWVENDSAGVTAEIQGPDDAVEAFLAGFTAAAPLLAVIERLVVSSLPAKPADHGPFTILASTSAVGAATSLPPDVATCAACLADVADPGNRRYRHPFAHCTDCGPRYTLITGLPYDRDQTTMRDFAMCESCAREYADPADRRHHAQANACPDCGPRVWLATADAPRLATGDAALEAARVLLQEGRIVAIKGVGGFHLACDATRDEAVELLRVRKQRGGKPLAVMVADLDAARRLAHVSPQEARLLGGRERPIVLLRKRADVAGLSSQVAPGNAFLGVVLPYSPLHHLLVAGMPPLVMTSGNRAEEPIVRDDATARRVLGPVADAFLLHDRPIEMACDDSVVRCAAGAILPIRRSRGYAPLPIRLPASGPCVLAVGGELKAAVCLADGDRAIMSQHIGDMGNLETLDALARTVDHLLTLFRLEPAVVAADLHPGYLSTGWARRFAAERGIPLVRMQHHEAHVAALVAEHGWRGRPLVAACFDGTGYGRDGTIQGGEFLGVEPGPTDRGGSIRRLAHLDHFPLPGGDAAIRHPRRTALALLHAAAVRWDDRLAAVAAMPTSERAVLAKQLARGVACTPTSSMGRLFDGVAALVGFSEPVSYEAEAALRLEACAAEAEVAAGYEFGIVDAAPLRIDWRPVVREVAAEAVAGVPAAVIAARFHRGVAAMIAEVCVRLQAGWGDTVGLTGGVFQNTLLVEWTIAALHRRGLVPLLHERVPPNDGGLALGQAWLASGGG